MSTDSMNILKYFIIFEVVLLILSFKLGGKTALIWTVVLSIVIVSLLFIFILSLASHAPPTRDITLSLITVVLLCSYLGFGVWTLFSTDKVLTLLSYVWLASVIISVVMFFKITHENSYKYQEYKEYKSIKKHEKKKASDKQSLEKLTIKYNLAMDDVDNVKGYIKLAENVAKENIKQLEIAEYFAAYTVKLMIEYISSKNEGVSLLILDSYLDSILPHVGIVDKSTDVASMGIGLSIIINDDRLFDKVTLHLLGDNINLDEVNNNILFFNLACYAALHKNKEELILYTQKSIAQGKSPESFFNDQDFTHYINDQDFINAVNSFLL